MTKDDVMVAALDAGFSRDWVMANIGKLVRLAVILNTPSQTSVDDAAS